MNTKIKLTIASTLFLGFAASSMAATKVNFNSDAYPFTNEEKAHISKIINQSEQEVRKLLPTLDETITVNVVTTDRNIDMVGGVFGRADAPGLLEVTLSTASKNGVIGSADTALTSSLYHEMHHLARGWTMTENRFGVQPGIPVATVNEGLASVFADTYTDEYFPLAYDYPEQAAQWLDEIMNLPKDANYGHWVSGFHPDGRSVIGYRIGRYVVHQAMEKTNKDILALSNMTPEAILAVVLSE
ncbi:DUF2268 domain-containing putative Zn-dependent protease [Litorilituus sediminis]|uniref:DUF2268 domain-containing protein n=1 Tax=Litorilituus sediminis TaxID=718192 RepID=A0A4P6P0R7_9GAMM|nr:DUF2268 domain-containing putative Zn-dependent protease [Litorilituus sediminis]QBG34736.1 hypothetical protein EMK97_02765 [Litorilituus sediminis]